MRHSAILLSRTVDFTFLKTKLDLTDGNLGAHLLTLEQAGYIVVEKTFVARKPKTFVAPPPPAVVHSRVTWRC